MIEYRTWILRKDLQKEPHKLFVFGDNMARVGYGGQARECRDEPNAVGIPTKWAPGMAEKDFFKDKDLPKIKGTLDAEFDRLWKHVQDGHAIVLPQDGIGTGLAELPKRAPVIYAYIQKRLEGMVRMDHRE